MSPFMRSTRMPGQPSRGVFVVIAESRKAIVAFVLGLLGPIAVLLASSNDLDWRSVASALVAGVIVGLGTYAVPNAPKADQ